MSNLRLLRLHKHARSALTRREAAGNFAQVVRGALLSSLFDRFRQQRRPWSFIDADAGAGLYDLNENDGGLQLHKYGVDKLWAAVRGKEDVPRALRPFARVLEAMNRPEDVPASRLTLKADKIRMFPGAASLARYFMREFDNAVLVESTGDEADAQVLDVFARMDRRFKAFSGLTQEEASRAFLPPRTRQGVALFELPSGSENMHEFVQRIKDTWLRWPNGTIAVYYPMETARRPIEMLREVYQLGFSRGVGCEFYYDYAGGKHQMRERMEGCGMFFLNAPDKFEDDMDAILRALHPLLSHCQIQPQGYRLSVPEGEMGVYIEWLARAPTFTKIEARAANYEQRQRRAAQRNLARRRIMEKMIVRAHERGEADMDQYFFDPDKVEDGNGILVDSPDINTWPDDFHVPLVQGMKQAEEVEAEQQSRDETAQVRDLKAQWSQTGGMPMFDFEFEQKLKADREQRQQQQTE
eukprot:TRINITY_DN67141_c8_g3_i1.p1 TRINITY_DN67141_c8_g3~~TRINITY_DN67141_c8_g3_i1.p1  ORF type:complete len:468 (+),score=261.82 TRINITY_DN67141_c8_g3_i1:62-1465(+)